MNNLSNRFVTQGLVNSLSLLLISIITTNSYAISFTSNILSGTSYETYGLSAGDINQDNCPDLLFSNHRFSPTIYVNNCDGSFTNSPQLLSGFNSGADTHGGAFADFDNDGDQDFYLVTGGNNPLTPQHQNEFYVNNNGLLDNQADSHDLLIGENRGRQPIWMDVNSDGALDVGVFGARESSILLQDLDENFTNTNAELGFSCDGFGRFALLSELGGQSGSNGQPKLDLLCGGFNFPEKMYDISPDLPQQFVDITHVVPVKVKSTADAVTADFNGDGHNDMFVVRQKPLPAHAVVIPGSNNRKFAASLMHNFSSPTSDIAARAVKIYTQGNIKLSLEASNLGQGIELKKQNLIWIGSENGIGHNPVPPISTGPPSNTAFELPADSSYLDATDPANQGLVNFDINYPSGQVPHSLHIGYVVDTANPQNSYWKISTYNEEFSNTIIYGDSTQAISKVEVINIKKLTAWERIHNPNSHNIEPAYYIYDPAAKMLAESGNSFEKITGVSVVSGDFDNDMDVDVIVACENIPETCDPYLYTNNGQGQFSLSRISGIAKHISESIVTADFDNDGFLDIAFSNGWFTAPFEGLQTESQTHALHLNTLTANNSIEFQLQGVESNKDGIGATVKITTPDQVEQKREQNNGVHRHSQNHQRLHFGLGSNNSVDIEVIWDNGHVDNFQNVNANALYKIVQGAQDPELLINYGQPSTNTISVNDVVVSEDGEFAHFEVSLAQAPGQDSVEFGYTTVDQSAVNGQDYLGDSAVIQMTGSSMSRMISVPIVDDNNVEAEENFNLQLNNVSGATLAKQTGVATIMDDDQLPANTLTLEGAQVDENAGTIILKFVLAREPGPNPVSFIFNTRNGTAIEGQDYTARSGRREFSGSTVEKYVSIEILDDNQIEDVEKFSVEISNLDGAQTASSSVDVVINDDDLPANVLSVKNIHIDESEGIAVFRLILSRAPGNEVVTFNFATQSGSAIDGVDYQGQSGYRIMTGTVTDKFVSVPIFDDNDVEEMEKFRFIVSNLSGAQINNSSSTASIIDNDLLSNTLTVSNVSVDESAGTALFKFSLSEAPGTNLIEFDFTTQNGTALDGQDFNGRSGYRSMTGPTKDTYLSIQITDDSQAEADESFSLEVSNVHGALIGSGAGSAVIIDND